MKLFELFATLGLQTDGFEKGARSAVRQGNALASSIGGNFTAISARAVALGNAMYDLGKEITKLSLDAVKGVITEYAETEQLVGGVETLFKDSADRLIELADNAFMTAGLSANEYMEQAVSFSATLLQGLGGDTEAAVSYADMAMTDMADNANKFGTNIAMIQNAYQGFAKDNYTMLDNLKLGYGGTQAEMARLINDSGVLGDAITVTAETVKDVPFDKVIEAIHIIQKRLGVTGTTAQEATDTVSGSIASFRAAWSNFVSGMASDDKEMSRLVDNLFDTGKNVVDNITKLLPHIWENTLEVVNDLLERWDVTSRLKKAFDEQGWQGVWDEATRITEEALAKWGPLAYDAGAGILAQVLTGITGDTVSADEIKATLNDLWAKGTEGATAFVNASKTVLSDFYEGLTGQEATAENIKNTLSGLFDLGKSSLAEFLESSKGLIAGINEGMGGQSGDAESIATTLGGLFREGSTAMGALKDSAGQLLGEIYTLITGQEATADNIGKTIGGVFSVGVNEAQNVLRIATTYFRDLSYQLGDPDASLAEKIGGVFTAGQTAMTALLEDASGFYADLYEAITGDKEGAEKVEKVLEDIFNVPQAIIDPQILTEYQGQDAHNDIWERDYLTMAQQMYASPYRYGVTESQADEWITTLRRYDSGEQYDEAIHAIIAAWESYEAASESEDEADDQMAESAKEMSMAAKALEAAAEKMASMSIVFDTGAIAGVVSSVISRSARASRYTVGATSP